MITSPASAKDFSLWERKAKGLSLDSLRFVIADCQSAARAMRGWNPDREGFYIDQAHTYQHELMKRTK
jgi:hypothetical protein